MHAGVCVMPSKCPPVHAGLVSASLAALRTGGRFVELAKRDVWSVARVAQERPDVTYALLAIDFLPSAVLRGSLHAIGVQVRLFVAGTSAQE